MNARNWVKKYDLEYVDESGNTHKYKDGEDLNGNVDHDTLVEHELVAFKAKSLKLRIRGFNSWPCMRMEAFYGGSCDGETSNTDGNGNDGGDDGSNQGTDCPAVE